MGNKFITEISYEDFIRLGLVGYRNTRVEVDEHSYRMEMLPVDLAEEIKGELDFCLKDGYRTIAVAIHTEPTEEAIQECMKLWTFDNKSGRRNYTREEAYKFALYEYSYLDKFMNRFTGHQTFQIGCGIEHLYSNRDYWYIKDDYWQVRKKETKAIYLVHLDEFFTDKPKEEKTNE